MNAITDTTEETINACAVSLFSKKPLQYDIPVCGVPAFLPLPYQYKHLFSTCPGKTTITEYFIPTADVPVKVPPQRIPANYHSQVEMKQLQMIPQEDVVEECLR